MDFDVADFRLTEVTSQIVVGIKQGIQKEENIRTPELP